MWSDADAVFQSFPVGELFGNLAHEPRLQKRDDDGAVVLCSQRMAVTKNAAQDAISTIDLRTGDEDFLRLDQSLVDEDANNLLAKLFLFFVIALNILDVKFGAFHKKIVRV